MIDRQPCVYILASKPYGTLYIGVTSGLLARLQQHRNGILPGFTSRYGVHILVRYELFGDMVRAIAREKQLKRWHRQWKIKPDRERKFAMARPRAGAGLSAVATNVKATRRALLRSRHPELVSGSIVYREASGDPAQ